MISGEELQEAARIATCRYIAAHPNRQPYFEQHLDDAVLGVCEAVRRFDSERGVPLKAYLAIKARYAILEGVRQRSPLKRSDYYNSREFPAARPPVSLDELHPDALQSVDPRYAAVENQELLSRLLASLSPREHEVIVRYFFRHERLRDIASDFGTTESRICQIKRTALKVMRDTANDQVAA